MISERIIPCFRRNFKELLLFQWALNYYRYKEGHFSKKEALRQIMNDPAYIGRPDVESPKHLAMDQIVDRELSDPSRKLVIFCQYTDQVEAYARRYARYGARMYYGELRSNSKGQRIDEQGNVIYFQVDDRDDFVLDQNGRPIVADRSNGRPMLALDYESYLFQNDPEARVLVANYKAGAVGVTFTAADAMIFDDLAPTYRDEYQAADRIHRIDNDRKKYQVRYYWMQARYPQSYLGQLPAEISTSYFPYTYDQAMFDILRQQERIFHRVMDGIGSEDEIDSFATNGIFRGRMPFLFQNGEGADQAESREEESGDFDIGESPTQTHHLPSYLWKPFKDALSGDFASQHPEAYDRIVRQGLGAARLESNGQITIEEEALPIFAAVLNRELKRGPPNELTEADVRNYLFRHESIHAYLAQHPEIVAQLLAQLNSDPTLYSSRLGIRNFEDLKNAFANNYGNQFNDDDKQVVEELLVILATELGFVNQRYLLPAGVDAKEGRISLPEDLAYALNSAVEDIPLNVRSARPASAENWKPGVVLKNLFQGLQGPFSVNRDPNRILDTAETAQVEFYRDVPEIDARFTVHIFARAFPENQENKFLKDKQNPVFLVVRVFRSKGGSTPDRKADLISAFSLYPTEEGYVKAGGHLDLSDLSAHVPAYFQFVQKIETDYKPKNRRHKGFQARRTHRYEVRQGHILLEEQLVNGQGLFDAYSAVVNLLDNDIEASDQNSLPERSTRIHRLTHTFSSWVPPFIHVRDLHPIFKIIPKQPPFVFLAFSYMLHYLALEHGHRVEDKFNELLNSKNRNVFYALVELNGFFENIIDNPHLNPLALPRLLALLNRIQPRDAMEFYYAKKAMEAVNLLGFDLTAEAISGRKPGEVVDRLTRIGSILATVEISHLHELKADSADPYVRRLALLNPSEPADVSVARLRKLGQEVQKVSPRMFTDLYRNHKKAFPSETRRIHNAAERSEFEKRQSMVNEAVELGKRDVYLFKFLKIERMDEAPWLSGLGNPSAKQLLLLFYGPGKNPDDVIPGTKRTLGEEPPAPVSGLLNQLEVLIGPESVERKIEENREKWDTPNETPPLTDRDKYTLRLLYPKGDVRPLDTYQGARISGKSDTTIQRYKGTAIRNLLDFLEPGSSLKLKPKQNIGILKNFPNILDELKKLIVKFTDEQKRPPKTVELYEALTRGVIDHPFKNFDHFNDFIRSNPLALGLFNQLDRTNRAVLRRELIDEAMALLQSGKHVEDIHETLSGKENYPFSSVGLLKKYLKDSDDFKDMYDPRKGRLKPNPSPEILDQLRTSLHEGGSIEGIHRTLSGLEGYPFTSSSGLKDFVRGSSDLRDIYKPKRGRPPKNRSSNAPDSAQSVIAGVVWNILPISPRLRTASNEAVFTVALEFVWIVFASMPLVISAINTPSLNWGAGVFWIAMIAMYLFTHPKINRSNAWVLALMVGGYTTGALLAFNWPGVILGFLPIFYLHYQHDKKVFERRNDFLKGGIADVIDGNLPAPVDIHLRSLTTRWAQQDLTEGQRESARRLYYTAYLIREEGMSIHEAFAKAGINFNENIVVVNKNDPKQLRRLNYLTQIKKESDAQPKETLVIAATSELYKDLIKSQGAYSSLAFVDGGASDAIRDDSISGIELDSFLLNHPVYLSYQSATLIHPSDYTFQEGKALRQDSPLKGAESRALILEQLLEFLSVIEKPLSPSLWHKALRLVAEAA